jgi:hypothetical protein
VAAAGETAAEMVVGARVAAAGETAAEMVVGGCTHRENAIMCLQ